jgi:lycopene beta-cyclase
MAAAVWRATWPVERIRQRFFNTFGMDLLLSLDLSQTRDFFSAFFSLSDFHWSVNAPAACCMSCAVLHPTWLP